MKQQFTIKTPGKLMVAGEFAVLEPYHKLIVMAVNRYVYCTIGDSDSNIVSLNDFDLLNLGWTYDHKEVVFQSKDPRLSFVKDALTTVLTYLHEQSISVQPFSLSIKSELDDKKTGAKYGLGSSAAVVTSVITAVLTKFLPETPSKKLIFKLAAISHVRTQGNGSGADIAASIYGGALLYSSFQANWLHDLLQKEKSITKMMNHDWEYLSIKKMQLPPELNFCVGWTGKPASTANLVNEIATLKVSNLDQYNNFLQESEQAVSQIVNGIKNKDLSNFFNGLKQNRKALAEVGKQAGVEIETDKLRILSKEAERLGGAGKLSGAGGGDCGIAFIPMHIRCEDLYQKWQDRGIEALELDLSLEGTSKINE